MASIEEALTAFGQRTAISAVVEDRVYDRILPPDTALPALVFTVIGPMDRLHSRGVERTRPYFVQWDVVAESAASCRDVDAVLRIELHGWRGNFGGIVVNRAIPDGLPAPRIEPSEDGAEDQIHRKVSRWAVHVIEPTAIAF